VGAQNFKFVITGYFWSPVMYFSKQFADKEKLSRQVKNLKFRERKHPGVAPLELFITRCARCSSY